MTEREMIFKLHMLNLEMNRLLSEYGHPALPEEKLKINVELYRAVTNYLEGK